MATKGDQLTSAHQKVDAAQAQYQRAQSSSASTGQQVSTDYMQLGAALSKPSGVASMERVWHARESANRSGRGGEWAAQRGGAMKTIANSVARDLPLEQRERLADFLVNYRQGGDRANEAVAALSPTIAEQGMTTGGSGQNAGLADASRVSTLGPSSDAAHVAGAAGGAARATGEGVEGRVSAASGRAASNIASGNGAPAATYSGGKGRVGSTYAKDSGTVAGAGREHGSNLGAKEFGEVEKRRDKADEARQIQRDRSDSQGGKAIDTAVGVKPGVAENYTVNPLGDGA